MKKYFFIVAAIMLTTVLFSCKDKKTSDPTPVASEDIYLYGYDNDKVDIATTVGNSSETAVTFDMATEFAGADIAAKATEIIGVRLYVADGAESGIAYIANTLGTRVAEKAFTVQNIGWQYVIFDAPVQVSADLTYYIGYESTGLGFFIGCDKVTGKDKLTYIYDEDEWVTFNSVGLTNYTLALQAICKGGDYSGETQHAYGISGCTFPENVRVGDKVEFDVTVMSLGVKTARNMHVTCICGPDELTADLNNFRNGESETLTFTLEGVSASMKEVQVVVTEEGVTESATKSYPINVYAADAPVRNCILIEEFTGQDCPNCPAGIATLRTAIEGMTNPEKAAWIAHHSGYYDDDFTLQGDKDIANAYGVNAAPMCMIDRTKVNYGTGTAELVWHPGYATSQLLNSLVSIPGDATINLNVEFTSDSAISVSVTGKSYKAETYITIVLCQNGITARQSNGGSNFVHNEVVRAYLTTAKGDQLTLDADGNYSHTASYTIPATIYNYKSTKNFATDIQNMYVVAFVHGKSASKGAVYNADKVELKDIMD